MKRLMWMWAPLLIALPLLAQRENFRRNPMERIQEVLTQAGVPLSGEQQTALRAIVEEQRRAMREAREQMGEAPGEGRGGFRPMGRMGEAMQDKIRGVLTPEQNAVWEKYRAEQIRRRGGYAALRLTLEEAGVPLTDEQQQQAQAAFRDYNQQRRELSGAAGGQADPAKLEELEKQHLSEIIQLLNAEQRRALLESRRKAQQQPN